jgi:hypothetical protein
VGPYGDTLFMSFSGTYKFEMAPRSGVHRFSKYLGLQKDDMTEVSK